MSPPNPPAAQRPALRHTTPQIPILVIPNCLRTVLVSLLPSIDSLTQLNAATITIVSYEQHSKRNKN